MINNEKKPGYLDITDFIDSIIKQDKKVIRYPIVGYWVDIGKLEDYHKVQEIASQIDS